LHGALYQNEIIHPLGTPHTSKSCTLATDLKVT
jgi:hypothetical protein